VNLTATPREVRAAGARLRARVRRAERPRRLQALALVLPMLAFLLAFFVLPIGKMLALSVDNRELREAMPRSAAALRAWDGGGLPDEAILAVLAEELALAREARSLAGVARRLNIEHPGFRSTVLGTARRLPERPEGSWRKVFLEADPLWGDPAIWTMVQRAADPWTPYYLLAALDLRRSPGGAIERAPPEQSIYVDLFARTFQIAGGVTLLCLLLGYPLAFKLASLPPRLANWLMILVLLPFWTSLLVRTTSWIVLLQREGPINQALVGSGLASGPLQLIYNRFGVYVAMTHILLPFMVLPLYSVMRGLDPAQMRAAASLGAPPSTAFLRVYLPQTLPGIGAGSLLVFILAIGYYITPALVGGPGDQMVSYFIAFFTNQTINWGMAAALASLLLAAILLAYWLYARLIGVERMRFG
jgi:putative spermidine/putrescine transport system permease protein